MSTDIHIGVVSSRMKGPSLIDFYNSCIHDIYTPPLQCCLFVSCLLDKYNIHLVLLTLVTKHRIPSYANHVIIAPQNTFHAVIELATSLQRYLRRINNWIIYVTTEMEYRTKNCWKTFMQHASPGKRKILNLVTKDFNLSICTITNIRLLFPFGHYNTGPNSRYLYGK